VDFFIALYGITSYLYFKKLGVYADEIRSRNKNIKKDIR
jgi:hypothetical protein